MFSLVSIVSITLIYLIKFSSECQSNATLWTYYPCSFIISALPSTCQYTSIESSIDECTNREMTFFWHFPYGNMTIILQSQKNRPFSIKLSKTLFLKNKLIKNVYHIHNKTLEEKLMHNNNNAILTIYSDTYNQCSLKFETTNSYVQDYGTFIHLKIFTDENEKS